MNFSERRKGCQEIRAGRAGSDADPTKDLIFCARVQNYFVGSEAGGRRRASRGEGEKGQVGFVGVLTNTPSMSLLLIVLDGGY
jgi:hypothetical protein